MNTYIKFIPFIIVLMLFPFTCAHIVRVSPSLSQNPQNDHQSCSLHADTGVSYYTDNIQDSDFSNFQRSLNE
jgi:hypothetical protein